MKKENNIVDELVWRRKEYLSARQTAANVTSYVFEGKEIKSADFLKYAEDIREWLWQEQLPFQEAPPKPVEITTVMPISVPMPNLLQKTVIDAIAAGGFSNDVFLWKEVLDFAEETYKVRTYPQKMETVGAFIKWKNEKDKRN